MDSSSFNCSQSDFIIVVETGINSYLQYLPRFTEFSPVYSTGWSDALTFRLTNAAAMPDEDTRRSESEAIRKELVKLNRMCCKAWQALKRYISRSFEPDIVYLKLKAAGANYYKLAANDGWPEASQMFTNAKNFIEANAKKLAAVMPASFPASFDKKVEEFRKTLALYEQSKETIMEGTQNRRKELNSIHRDFMEMMLDGQEIFSDDEAVRKQFVFTDILSRVSGAGLAGIRGSITDTVTNAAIANATIIIKNGNGITFGTTTSDEAGKFLHNSPSGTYDVTVIANGYITRTVNGFTVDVGTVSKLDIALSPEVAEEE